MSSMFGGGGGGGGSTPQYLPPPPPPPTPTLANFNQASGYDPTRSLMGDFGGTRKTGGQGLDTETNTTKKSLLGD
jgi:hypothetical protein